MAENNGRWVTINGAHVFIEKGQTVNEALDGLSKGKRGKKRISNGKHEYSVDEGKSWLEMSADAYGEYDADQDDFDKTTDDDFGFDEDEYEYDFEDEVNEVIERLKNESGNYYDAHSFAEQKLRDYSPKAVNEALKRFDDFGKGKPEYESRDELIERVHDIEKEYTDGISEEDRPTVEKDYGKLTDDQWGYVMQEVNRSAKPTRDDVMAKFDEWEKLAFADDQDDATIEAGNKAGEELWDMVYPMMDDDQKKRFEDEWYTGTDPDALREIVEEAIGNEGEKPDIEERYSDIAKMRRKGMSDQKILEKLVGEGYDEQETKDFLGIGIDDDETEEQIAEPPAGYEKFNGRLDDPYQRMEVGKKVIAKDGTEYFITDADDLDKSHLWVSENEKDVETGKGRALHRDDVAFVASESGSSERSADRTRQDMIDDVQRDIDHDIKNYGSITSDTKLKAERVGLKIDGDRVIGEESGSSAGAGGAYSAKKGDRWTFDDGSTISVENVAGDKVEISTPSGTQWVTKDELADMTKNLIKGVDNETRLGGKGNTAEINPTAKWKYNENDLDMTGSPTGNELLGEWFEKNGAQVLGDKENEYYVVKEIMQEFGLSKADATRYYRQKTKGIDRHADKKPKGDEQSEEKAVQDFLKANNIAPDSALAKGLTPENKKFIAELMKSRKK